MSTEASSSSARPAELVAGFLSVISIVGSVAGARLVPAAVHPVRGAARADRGGDVAEERAPAAARRSRVGAICFVVGLTIAVATDNPIY